MARTRSGETTGHPQTGHPQPEARPRFPKIQVERHRGDMSGPQSYANTLLRIAVILLSSINAVMWEVYTESTFMAVVWVAIVVGFIGWMIYESRNR
jgi:hypothetical protein